MWRRNCPSMLSPLLAPHQLALSLFLCCRGREGERADIATWHNYVYIIYIYTGLTLLRARKMCGSSSTRIAISGKPWQKWVWSIYLFASRYMGNWCLTSGMPSCSPCCLLLKVYSGVWHRRAHRFSISGGINPAIKARCNSLLAWTSSIRSKSSQRWKLAFVLPLWIACCGLVLTWRLDDEMELILQISKQQKETV